MQGIELDALNRAVRFLRCSGWKECSCYEDGKDLTEHWFYCISRDDHLEIKLIIPELEKLSKHFETNYRFNVFDIFYNYAKPNAEDKEKYDSIQISYAIPAYMKAGDECRQSMVENFMKCYFEKSTPNFEETNVQITAAFDEDKKVKPEDIESMYDEMWKYAYKTINYHTEILLNLYEKCSKLREKLWKQWFIGVEEFKNIDLNERIPID